ncbi:hypothetical protein [Stenoxybacter acetivorans]|uniref:hypothetical protein n=1 Tax=Stenoxybacter acetivorans TaxID=422441 RepID=UPI00068C7E9B|nr:hypothetical protein [Stenoxybacter acetivorans]
MNKDLEDFLREQAPEKSQKRSVLEPYCADILELKKRGYSESVILQYLAEKKNVSVTRPTLNRFIRNTQKHLIESHTTTNRASQAKPTTFTPISQTKTKQETTKEITFSVEKTKHSSPPSWAAGINPEDVF